MGIYMAIVFYNIERIFVCVIANTHEIEISRVRTYLDTSEQRFEQLEKTNFSNIRMHMAV